MDIQCIPPRFTFIGGYLICILFLEDSTFRYRCLLVLEMAVIKLKCLHLCLAASKLISGACLQNSIYLLYLYFRKTIDAFFMVISDGIFKAFFLSKYTLWNISYTLTFDYTYFKVLYEVFLFFFLEDDQMLEEIRTGWRWRMWFAQLSTIPTSPPPSALLHIYCPTIILVIVGALKLSCVDLGNFKIDISSSGQRIPILVWKAFRVESGDLFVLHQSWWNSPSPAVCLLLQISTYSPFHICTSNVISHSENKPYCYFILLALGGIRNCTFCLHHTSHLSLIFKEKDDDVCKISFSHNLLLFFIILNL